MKVLYVSGSPSQGTPAPMEELAQITPAFEVQVATGAAAALVEMRTVGGYDSLFISPDLPHNEALALIASLRRDRVPVAIVAIVADTQQDFFAPAITAGADDVLLMRDGSLVSPADTLKRVRQSRYLEPEDGQHPLQALYAGDDDLAWDLLAQMPFLHVERIACGPDGTIPMVMDAADGSPVDVVIVDEHPGEAHPLQVVKAVKAKAAEMTTVVLTSPTGADIGGAAFDLGADDVVSKAGVYRRRLVASLHRIFVKRHAASADAEQDRSVPFRPVFGSGEAPSPDDADRLRDALADAEHRLADLENAMAGERSSSEATCQQFADQARAAEDALANERERWETARQSLEERLQELGGLEREYQTLLDTVDALRTENAALTEASAAARAGQGQDQHELEALRHTLADERTTSDATCQQLRDQVRAAEDALAAERERSVEARHSFEERLQDLSGSEQAYQALVDTVGLLRTENAALTEALGFERALRERDRTELESAKHALAEERGRLEVLDVTLRQTEERAAADLAALQSEHTSVRRSLEDRLAIASERLHAIANETQALQVRLENEESSRTEAHEHLSTCDVFGHALMRTDGTLVRCNDAFARMFGYADAREALDLTAGTSFPAMAGRPELDAQLAADGRLSGVTSVVRHTDGRQFYILESATLLPARDDEAPLVERVCVEAGDRARLESELRLARRLEVAGRLAAEMAPEIDPLLRTVEQPSGATDADRARTTALVRQLLSFARRQAQPAGFLSLNDAIRRGEALLRRIAGEYTDFQLLLAADLDAIAAGETDVEQLLTTVVFTASALLPMGGSIALETRRTEATTDQGPGALLIVTASGYGLRTATLPDTLELAATRCGGHASLTTDDNRAATFRVALG